MLKKVVVGTLLVGLIGMLVFGAINRTMDRTGKVAEAQGPRGGAGRTGNEPDARGGYGRTEAAGGEGRGAGGDQAGSGQAQVEAWLQLQGTVVSADADALVVQTAAGEQVAVENRPWWFAQEQGFAAQVGDQLTLTGFYEGDAFEVGRIDDATNGQTALLRDESGRPMWAGRGRRGA